MGIVNFKMMANAGLVVKLVMITLVHLFPGLVDHHHEAPHVPQGEKRLSRDFLDAFWDSKTLNEAYDSAREHALSPEATVFVAGYNELKKISAARKWYPAGHPGDAVGHHGQPQRAVRKAQFLESDRMARSISFLATAGSATLFIGLFGTASAS